MIKSMTGFGSANAKTADLEVDISLKSYNGRFLDLRVHLPREYEAFEGAIKKKLASKILRGTVSMYVSRKLSPGSKLIKVETDVALAKKIKKSMDKLQKELGLQEGPTLQHILNWQSVVSISENTKISAQEKTKLLAAVDRGITALNRERSREGKSLSRDLKAYAADLKKVVRQIRSLSQQTQKKARAKLKKRLELLDDSIEMDTQRLAQEAALQADKMDISEEIVRLEEHLSAFTKELTVSGTKGKKLDFYTQELLREVNTIASKSSLAKINHLSVEAKSLIEKIKEQVQNVE